MLVKGKRSAIKLSASVLLFFVFPGVQAAEDDMQQVCENLASQSTPAFRVDRAEWVSGDSAGNSGGPGSADLPDHCLFQVILDPRESGFENLSYGVGTEVRLPMDWNGRLLMQGGGGLNGSLNPALGRVRGAASALERGFAVVSTDGGHQGLSNTDTRFGEDQQAKIDFAWQAVERSAIQAKAVVRDFYGEAPEYTYFMGCSTGGREGMMAAQRMPLLFDGVIAGNAPFNFSRMAINQVWSLQTVNRIAPNNADGNPDMPASYSNEQLSALKDGLLARCDALDGLADGMVNDYLACDFEPAMNQCGVEGAPGAGQCLSTVQVEGLNDILGGARNSRGESIYGSTFLDTGIAGSAWRGMHLGNPGGRPANAFLGGNTLSLYNLTPPVTDFDPLAFDMDTAVEVTAESAAITDAVATLHTTFVDLGGKLIVYNGLSDQSMFSGPLIEWYENITPRTEEGPQDWARLFLVPGMSHCGGGESTDQFDMLTAIQNWVENGEAPDSVFATGNAFPGIERPLCPYPQVARFKGGDENSVESFACEL